MTPEQRITEALEIALSYGCTDGGHHKMWVIDQMVRALLDCPKIPVLGAFYDFGESEAYRAWVQEYESGEDGSKTYEWDIGTAP